jgi:2-polyprenyl-6-methoxyphenol hydroxylase-like FAD-dependent oxidoreductase
VTDADIIVIGAGPVGMLAALLSAQQGLGVLLLEQSARRHIQSRANGITPSSLEILGKLGLADVFIEHGVAVRVSEVYGRSMRLGRIDFTGLQSEFPFVLSIPQDRTETLLEEAVLADTSVRFLRDHRVTNCSEEEDHAVVSGNCSNAGTFHFTGQYVLACDGGKSTVRESLGIPFEGAPERYTYLMGDYEDSTGWGKKARFFFTARGSVESFPLPDGKRRHVVRTPRFIKECTTGYLGTELFQRAGINVAGVRQ